MTPMPISLLIEEPGLAEDDLQEITRELCQTINAETDVAAELQHGAPVRGGKGEPITLATLALTFFTSGAAVALFEIFKAYFERNASLKVVLNRPDGERLEIGAENLRSGQIDETLALAGRFLDKEES